MVRAGRSSASRPRGAVESGTPASAANQTLPLAPGRWLIALQYAATVPITVIGPGLRATLPATVEPRGPYWLVGTVTIRRRHPTRITVREDQLPWLGRALGAFGLTRAPDPDRAARARSHHGLLRARR